MIEVKVDSIRVGLMNQQRVVLLKELTQDRYLPIWIGQFEADAITFELRDRSFKQRPMTHDLLKNVIEQMGGRLRHILINDMRKEVYFARLVIEVRGETIEIDARPSDAIAIAVRAKAPIFVAEAVLDKSGVEPEEEIDLGSESTTDFALERREPRFQESATMDDTAPEEVAPDDVPSTVDDSQLSAFADFLNSLDLDELDKGDDN